MTSIVSQSNCYFHLHKHFLFWQWFLPCAIVITFIFNYLAGLAFFVKVWTSNGFLLTHHIECITCNINTPATDNILFSTLLDSNIITCTFSSCPLWLLLTHINHTTLHRIWVMLRVILNMWKYKISYIASKCAILKRIFTNGVAAWVYISLAMYYIWLAALLDILVASKDSTY